MNYPDRYLLFIEYFNQGKFMSAQSTLSEVWLETGGEDKNFFGGLTQLTVSLYHLQEKNPQGAKANYEKSLPLLASYGEKHLGLELGNLLRETKALFQALETNPEAQITSLPNVKFQAE